MWGVQVDKNGQPQPCPKISAPTPSTAVSKFRTDHAAPLHRGVPHDGLPHNLLVSSLETHTMADSCDQATAGSPFFRVLPPEVRICILTAAFGGRKIHIQRIQLATPKPQAQYNRWIAARESTRQWLGGLLVDSLAEKLSHGGRSCDLELAVPSTPFDPYQDEAFKNWQLHRIAGPAWEKKQNEHFSFCTRMRLFWAAQEQRLDSDTGRHDGRGTDVGYWISMSEWDRLGFLGKS